MYFKEKYNKAVRGSVEAISLAVTSIGLPQRYELRESEAKTAAVILSVNMNTKMQNQN